MPPFRPANDAESYPPIADYAAIGDCRTIALLSRQGSVDWLCFPSASDPAVFAALLDRRRGGRFAIRPAEPFRTERRYLSGTNVLETTFTTAAGQVRVTDLMVLNGTGGGQIEPERELLRIVDGVAGRVRLEVLYDPRPDYARATARHMWRGPALGWVVQHRGEAFRLLAEVGLRLGPEKGLVGQFLVGPGDRVRFSLTHATRDMLVIPPMGLAADHRLERTVQWWGNWSRQCRFEGRHREMALRSALMLKLLTYGLSGAVLAAATTSLPEAIGAARNYDYRFCWLRDAAVTLRAFSDLGFGNESRAYLTWLLHSTRLTRPKLMVFYDVHGRRSRAYQELPHLEGYQGSSPVRVGNDALEQLQHDAYSSAIDAAATIVRCGGRLARDEQKLLVRFGRQVCATWREPDSGLWEVPGARRHYVHSKLLCWSALEVLLQLDEDGYLKAPRVLFEAERLTIRRAIETDGFSAGGGAEGSYTGAFGEDWVDASLLIMARLGFHEAGDRRIAATAERVWRDLGRNGLLLRYLPSVDGLPSREGAFGVCAFWAVELLALQGRLDEAEDLFEKTAALANDVGLMAEEYDPDTGAALGNAPQAFTHAGLISAALTLQTAASRDAKQ